MDQGAPHRLLSVSRFFSAARLVPWSPSDTSGGQKRFSSLTAHALCPARPVAACSATAERAPRERPQLRHQDGGGAPDLVRGPARPGGWRGGRGVCVWALRRFASGASARGLLQRTPLLPRLLRGRAENGGVLPDLQAACGRVRAATWVSAFRSDGEQHGGAVSDLHR
jgi:hypothetical protein